MGTGSSETLVTTYYITALRWNLDHSLNLHAVQISDLSHEAKSVPEMARYTQVYRTGTYFYS
jgi:hypothetical protein